jgi:hypothetical protein
MRRLKICTSTPSVQQTEVKGAKGEGLTREGGHRKLVEWSTQEAVDRKKGGNAVERLKRYTGTSSLC